MKFMLEWAIEPGCYDEAVKRFLAGTEKIPKGVKMIGRWHGTAHGWVLLETNDLVALTRYMTQWQSLIHFEVTPVTDDAETAAALK